MQATFKHGSTHMMDYTPSSAVSGGDVVVIGALPQVAHRDIAASEQGALSAFGGVYEMTADAAISAGAKVYWDDTNNKVTTTASGAKHFGYLVDDTSASADGDSVNVLHLPDGTAIA